MADAHISVDGKQHLIGYNDNEEEAAIDYARAVFKYKTEITQKGTPSAKQTDWMVNTSNGGHPLLFVLFSGGR
jgi:hypothetical protein